MEVYAAFRSPNDNTSLLRFRTSNATMRELFTHFRITCPLPGAQLHNNMREVMEDSQSNL